MQRAPRYLALDIANATGYALAEGGKITRSGVRDFKLKPHERKGHRGIKFYNFLLEMGHVDAIFHELVMMAPGKYNQEGKFVGAYTSDARELYHGLLMLVNMYAAGFGIPVYEVHVSTLKKDFTGRGNATKEEMCDEAIRRGWKGGVPGTALYHDECDACAILITQCAKRGHTVSF